MADHVQDAMAEVFAARQIAEEKIIRLAIEHGVETVTVLWTHVEIVKTFHTGRLRRYLDSDDEARASFWERVENAKH